MDDIFIMEIYTEEELKILAEKLRKDYLTQPYTFPNFPIKNSINSPLSSSDFETNTDLDIDPELEILHSSNLSSPPTSESELASSNENFQIFSTIRFDPLIYKGSPDDIPRAIDMIPLDESFFFLLDEHVGRLKRAGNYFGFPVKSLNKNILLHHLSLALQNANKSIANRVRVFISNDGEYQIDFAPLPSSHQLSTEIPDYSQIQKGNDSIPQYLRDWTGWEIYLDKETSTQSPFTSFKTTRRDTFNKARERFNIIPGDNREVLMIDNNDNVTEGTISSVAFWRQIKDSKTGEVIYKWITPHLGLGCMDSVVRKMLLDNGQIIQGIVPTRHLKDGEYVLLMNALMGIKPAKLIISN